MGLGLGARIGVMIMTAWIVTTYYILFVDMIRIHLRDDNKLGGLDAHATHPFALVPRSSVQWRRAIRLINGIVQEEIKCGNEAKRHHVDTNTMMKPRGR